MSLIFFLVGDKILVIGGSGLVGGALVRAWRRLEAEVSATAFQSSADPGLRRLDIREPAAVERLIQELRPRIVALPAANPHVDYCERHPEETREVNVAGVLNAVRASRELGAKAVFFSSDYVFDGGRGNYEETDARSPINEYGRQKAEAEELVLAADPGNLVIRTAGAYGWQREPKNFVLQVRRQLMAGLPMRVAADVRYNPTYVENLAEVTAQLCQRGLAGVFHVVGGERLLRLEFARLAARAFGLDEALIEALPSAETLLAAPRPKESSLDTGKVRAALSTPLWGARQGLEHMVAFEARWRGPSLRNHPKIC